MLHMAIAYTNYASIYGRVYSNYYWLGMRGGGSRGADVDVDVVDLRAQADASMPASNNNVNYTIYSNF